MSQDSFDTSRNAEFLAEFREGVGPVVDPFPCPPETLITYTNKLPPILIDLLREDGLGSLYGGQLWVCDPAEFASVSQALFAGDPQLVPEKTHIVGYTVFGTVVFYNQDFDSGEADMVRGIVKCPQIQGTRERSVNLDAISAFEAFSYDDHWADEQDADGKWLYRRAVKTLGPAAYGECYGLVPALALGGAWSLYSMKRVKAVEHFVLLAQMQPFVLRDTLSHPIRDVRVIGSQ